jgi:hypothetical protein
VERGRAYIFRKYLPQESSSRTAKVTILY